MSNIFWNKLIEGKKPVAAEYDPPVKADFNGYLPGINELKEAGADIITMADCPSGRARMDAIVTAALVSRMADVEVIPHLTCRDRNSTAVKSTLLSVYASGIRNMILVTGDPVPVEDKDKVKPVFEFNSKGLISMAASMNNQFEEPLRFFGALNINAASFKAELDRAKLKIEAGAVGFFTQPVLTEEAFENLRTAKNELGCFILGGIIPITSEKNAIFMNESVPGIKVDEKVISMYSGKDRDECEKIAIELSAEIASRIASYVDGFYLITPFNRTGLIAKIIDIINK